MASAVKPPALAGGGAPFAGFFAVLDAVLAAFLAMVAPRQINNQETLCYPD
jgi:hypothetical protein